MPVLSEDHRTCILLPLLQHTGTEIRPLNSALDRWIEVSQNEKSIVAFEEAYGLVPLYFVPHAEWTNMCMYTMALSISFHKPGNYSGL